MSNLEGNSTHRVSSLNGFPLFSFNVTKPILDVLPNLDGHFTILLSSFFFFTLVHLYIAPAALGWLFPQSYGKCTSRKARNNWAIHVVSQIHVLIILPLALRCITIPELNQDRAFGWDEKLGTCYAVAAGYFLWDTLDAVINFIDIGFVLHGVACLLLYTSSFKPLMPYYGVRGLIWETSTLFLNIHWFLDKIGQTGGKLQLYNGGLLIATFFCVRIIYGGMTAYDFQQTLFDEKDRISSGYLRTYTWANIGLQVLNWFWFSKMIAAIRRRFKSKKLKSA